MRFKKGKAFYKLPKSVENLRSLAVKKNGGWDYLEPINDGDIPKFIDKRGDPCYFKFYNQHLEVLPAPKKASYARLTVIERRVY